MLAVDNARSYDWKTWGIGIMRSFLSGGAAALVTSGGGAIAGITAKQQYIMMGASFIGLGLYRLGEFLQLHGAPDALQKSLDTAAAASKEAAVASSKAVSAVEEAQSIAPQASKQ